MLSLATQSPKNTLKNQADHIRNTLFDNIFSHLQICTISARSPFMTPERWVCKIQSYWGDTSRTN